jgi:hypothetical protein
VGALFAGRARLARLVGAEARELAVSLLGRKVREHDVAGSIDVLAHGLFRVRARREERREAPREGASAPFAGNVFMSSHGGRV